MGTICLRQDKGSIIYDAISPHDFEENHTTASIIELLQELNIL